MALFQGVNLGMPAAPRVTPQAGDSPRRQKLTQETAHDWTILDRMGGGSATGLATLPLIFRPLPGPRLAKFEFDRLKGQSGSYRGCRLRRSQCLVYNQNVARRRRPDR